MHVHPSFQTDWHKIVLGFFRGVFLSSKISVGLTDSFLFSLVDVQVELISGMELESEMK